MRPLLGWPMPGRNPCGWIATLRPTVQPRGAVLIFCPGIAQIYMQLFDGLAQAGGGAFAARISYGVGG